MTFGAYLWALRWFWLATTSILSAMCLAGPTGQGGALGIAPGLTILTPLTWFIHLKQ